MNKTFPQVVEKFLKPFKINFSFETIVDKSVEIRKSIHSSILNYA